MILQSNLNVFEIYFGKLLTTTGEIRFLTIQNNVSESNFMTLLVIVFTQF